MKEIKIFFVDFWKGFNNKNNFILSALKNQYHIIIDPHNPDYLFYSLFGSDHFRYQDSIKIYFTGENDVPDFNLCDYGIASALLTFGDRYFRLPLYTLYDGYEDVIAKVGNVGALHTTPLQQQYLQRKFCNFVYSNAQLSNPIREEFFHRLSLYKQVDSGGKYLNNIGGQVDDKINFIKDYKFTIAFENSSVSGYTTEKLLDPMQVNSIPIYWGNPNVDLDFNTKSFINIADYQSIDEVIKEIIYLDTHDEAYLEKLSQPWIGKEQKQNFLNELSIFLKNIIEQPVPLAKRTTPYGFFKRYREKQFISSMLYENKWLRPVLKKIILPLHPKKYY
ncbi:fucosyltransferase [Bacteroidia bacterium]|nr:fucosyltransferase [Bacteroidia bacterium]